MRVILASASPRRKKFFEELGIDFEIIPSDCDERVDESLSPEKRVEEISKKKLEDVRKRTGDDEALIVASDTLVFAGNRILGKPKDDEDAKDMLRLLSGTEHYVISGVAASYRGKTASASERTAIVFRDVSEKEILRYVRSGEHRDKAGAYGIQEKGGFFTKEVRGDLNNVVGLPIYRLGVMLEKEFGIDLYSLGEKTEKKRDLK